MKPPGTTNYARDPASAPPRRSRPVAVALVTVLITALLYACAYLGTSQTFYCYPKNVENPPNAFFPRSINSPIRIERFYPFAWMHGVFTPAARIESVLRGTEVRLDPGTIEPVHAEYDFNVRSRKSGWP